MCFVAMEVTWVSTSLSVVFLFFVLINIINIFLQKRRETTTDPHLPPSPPSIPILGHLHLLKGPVHRQLYKLSQKYGPILFLRFGSRPVVIVSSPSAVQECFTKNDVVLANRPFFKIVMYLFYNYTTIGSAPYGDHWRNLRRLSALEIFSPKGLNMFQGIRREEVDTLLRRLSRNSRGGFGRVGLRPLLTALTCNIITRMFTGKRYCEEDDVESEESKSLQKVVGDVSEVAGAANARDFLPFLRWLNFGVYEKKLKKISTEKDKIFQGLIDEYRSGLDRDDDDQLINKNCLFHRLLELQKSAPEYYTDEIIKGFLLDLTLAATETTATTLEWAMSLLLNHPDVLEKARAELYILVGEDRLMEESDFPKLQYLQNIISETLRLCQPIPLLLPHMASNNCQIGGFDMPKNTILFVNTWAIHRDPKLWEDATSFKPSRFENRKSDTSYKLLPFGEGRRACPGAGLANRVLGLALGSLIQCYDWERVGDKEVDMTEGIGITVPKLEPLEAMCRARPVLQKVL